jgi:hypothetical protein
MSMTYRKLDEGFAQFWFLGCALPISLPNPANRMRQGKSQLGWRNPSEHPAL